MKFAAGQRLNASARPGDSLARLHSLSTLLHKEKIVFYDTSARHDSQPRLFSLLAIALTPWHMLEKLMTERQTRAELSRLDDYMLKDIGLSRSSIDSAIRNGRRRH